MKFKFLVILAIGILALSSCNETTPKVTPAEAKQIAKEAYIYGFPMVLNYKTMYSYTINKKSPEFKGDFNQLASSSARRMCTGLCLYQHLAPLKEDKFTPVFDNACPSRIAH